MELTPDIILNGQNATKKLPVAAYGGAEIEIKPLSSGVYETLARKHKITPNMQNADQYRWLMEVCKEGIVNETMKGLVSKMTYDAVGEIGKAILEYSSASDKEIEDFTKPAQDS